MLVSTRPPRLRVDVRGELPDTCTEIDRVDIQRSGPRIEIRLDTRRPFGAQCAAVLTPFSRSIPMPLSDDYRHYTIDVNGVVDSVLLPPDLPPRDSGRQRYE